ncbi:MAG: family 78 glycoside hydrolase catalytic domain, partial [Clostridia bacterium]|nr:family 78 glycoside hydrolase catalytic domain [Clostridia bacterium]
MAEFKVYGSTVNYLKNPCGIDENPSFSYKLSSSERGGAQKNRRICVKEALTGNTVWDSGVVETKEQLFVSYAGEKLKPITKYEFTVEVSSESGETSSETGSFVTGKLDSKWIGKWINAKPVRRYPDAEAAQYLRNTFDVKENVSAAYLSICGLGYFESYINGTKTGDDMLSPAFTRYDAESMYLVYDVKDLLKTGKNAIGVALGNGWYNCFTQDNWNTPAASWRHFPKLICELHITYADGTKQIMASDPNVWKSSKGPITFNSIRNGEYYDARLELGAWTEADYDDSEWVGTKIMKSPGGKLIAMEFEPIRVRKTFTARKMWKSKNGYTFDIGQNQAGVGRFKVRGAAGTEITFRYSDVLNS